MNIPVWMLRRKSCKCWEIVRLCQCQASYYIASSELYELRVPTIRIKMFNFLCLLNFHFTCCIQKLLWCGRRLKKERAIKLHSSKKILIHHRGLGTGHGLSSFLPFFWPLQVLSYLPTKWRYFAFNDYLLSFYSLRSEINPDLENDVLLSHISICFILKLFPLLNMFCSFTTLGLNSQ